MITHDGNVDLHARGHNGNEWRGGELSDIEKVFMKARLRRERLGRSVVMGSFGRVWRDSVGWAKKGRRKRARDVEWANACD